MSLVTMEHSGEHLRKEASGIEVCLTEVLESSKSRQTRKGVPWTEEEHRLFIIGLQKYGKGDWRNITRNYVISRTPTQVASHAQKYYRKNKLSEEKEKMEHKIHHSATGNHKEAAPSKKVQAHPKSTLIRLLN